MEPESTPSIAFYFLVLIAIASTVRSLIHILAPDGGANSIAGLAINWLAILRYRFMVPFMLAIVFLEQVMRISVGHLKPIEVAKAPPGEIGSYIMLALSMIALVISLRKRSEAS